MNTENVVLMKMAREALKDKWGIAIGTFVVYTLIIIAVQVSTEFFPFAGLIGLLISGPMTLGLAIFSINISAQINFFRENQNCLFFNLIGW